MIEKTNDFGVWSFLRSIMSSVLANWFTKTRIFDWGALSTGSNTTIEIFLNIKLFSRLFMCTKPVFTTYDVVLHFYHAKSG